MNWLSLSARVISKSIPEDRFLEYKDGDPTAIRREIAKQQMTSVIWTTPLGLPIVQPYRKVKRKQV